MRLGIGSYTYGWAVGAGALSALDLIGLARAFGVEVVQLCDNLPASTFAPESVEAIADAAGRAGVSVQVGTKGTRPDHLRRLAEVARRLGSPVLRLVIDDGDDRPEPEEVVRRVRSVLGDFEKAGVTLAIENHDRFPARLLAGIVREIGGPHVGICLDTVNSFGALEGPEAVVEALGPLVVNLHLKDFAVVRMPHLQGFVVEGRPLGQGRLDVPRLLGRLRAFGRDPDAILEHWTPPEPEPDATIHKEADWAEASVKAARHWIAG